MLNVVSANGKPKRSNEGKEPRKDAATGLDARLEQQIVNEPYRERAHPERRGSLPSSSRLSFPPRASFPSSPCSRPRPADGREKTPRREPPIVPPRLFLSRPCQHVHECVLHHDTREATPNILGNVWEMRVHRDLRCKYVYYIRTSTTHCIYSKILYQIIFHLIFYVIRQRFAKVLKHHIDGIVKVSYVFTYTCDCKEKTPHFIIFKNSNLHGR